MMSVVSKTNSESVENAYKEHGQISLEDNTRPVEDPSTEEPAAPPTPGELLTPSSRTFSALSKKLSRRGIEDERTKWKYRKYQEDRYAELDKVVRPERPRRSSTQATSKSLSQEQKHSSPSTPAPENATSPAEDDESRFRQGQKKVRNMLHTTTYAVEREGNSAIDILYENQRGSFFFGMPYYSSNSLLNFDPPAWTNSLGKPSSVDVTNAQLPDGSTEWRWAWSCWFVDMSGDVDEEGWQYSFMFQKRFSWHGTHPWGHSFVRRRRWIRKRVKKALLRKSIMDQKQGVAEMHRMNADYFTIHPRRNLMDSSGQGSSAAQSFANSAALHGSGDTRDEDEELDTLRGLLSALKKSTVDREKIGLVLQFMHTAFGGETNGLADEIPHILSLFLYQASRKKLLTQMLQVIGEASDHREGHQEQQKPEPEAEKKCIDGLMKAVHATEKEVQRLEFWSDVRGVVGSGQAFRGPAAGNGILDDWVLLRKEDADQSSRTTGDKASVSLPTGKAKGKETQASHGPEWDDGWKGLDASGPASAVAPKTDEKGRILDEEVEKSP